MCRGIVRRYWRLRITLMIQWFYGNNISVEVPWRRLVLLEIGAYLAPVAICLTSHI